MRPRLIAVALAITLIGAACGGDDDAAGQPSEPALPPAQPTTAAPSPEDPTPETVVDPTAPPAATTEASTRTVVTAFGEFEVPAAPQRVAVLDPVIALPTVLDLGVNVIGTLSFGGGKPQSTLVTDAEWEPLDVLGASNETSLETVAAADPDMILISPSSEEEFLLYAELAPAVPIVLSNVWQEDGFAVADALGKATEYQALLDDYQARADDVGARIDAELGDPAVAVVRIRPGSIRVHTSAHFAGNILGDVGLRMPEEWMRERLEDPVENLMQRIEQISLEQLGLLGTADHLIVLVQGTAVQTEAEVQAAFEEVTSSALWQTLPAVAAGDVHFVENYWIAGSLRAAERAVADLEAIFLDG